MPALSDTLEELFQTKDLYVVLGIEGDGKTATERDLKKSYHKSSLKYHPDRVARGPSDSTEEATKKFQALGAVYKILSDKDSRALYDETGEIADDDGAVGRDDRDWNEYWRNLFPRVTAEDVQEFERNYKGSEEEEKDLIASYERFKGNMDRIPEEILCVSIDDEPRLAAKLQELIDKGVIKEYPAFRKKMSKAAKTRRASKAKKEAKEAKELAEELGYGANSSLENMIEIRQAARARHNDSFLDQLAAKYAKKK